MAERSLRRKLYSLVEDDDADLSYLTYKEEENSIQLPDDILYYILNAITPVPIAKLGSAMCGLVPNEIRGKFALLNCDFLSNVPSRAPMKGHGPNLPPDWIRDDIEFDPTMPMLPRNYRYAKQVTLGKIKRYRGDTIPSYYSPNTVTGETIEFTSAESVIITEHAVLFDITNLCFPNAKRIKFCDQLYTAANYEAASKYDETAAFDFAKIFPAVEEIALKHRHDFLSLHTWIAERVVYYHDKYASQPFYTTIDTVSFPKLQTLIVGVYGVPGDQLELAADKLPALCHLETMEPFALKGAFKNLNSIDVRDIPTGIHNQPALKKMVYSGRMGTNVQLSGLDALEELQVNIANSTRMVISDLKSLTALDVSARYNGNVVVLTGNLPNLETVRTVGTVKIDFRVSLKIKKMDVFECDLETLKCYASDTVKSLSIAMRWKFTTHHLCAIAQLFPNLRFLHIKRGFETGNGTKSPLGDIVSRTSSTAFNHLKALCTHVPLLALFNQFPVLEELIVNKVSDIATTDSRSFGPHLKRIFYTGKMQSTMSDLYINELAIKWGHTERKRITFAQKAELLRRMEQSALENSV